MFIASKCQDLTGEVIDGFLHNHADLSARNPIIYHNYSSQGYNKTKLNPYSEI